MRARQTEWFAILLATAVIGLGLLAGPQAAQASPITLHVTGQFTYNCGRPPCQGSVFGTYSYDPSTSQVVGPWSFGATGLDGIIAAGNGMGNPADASLWTCLSQACSGFVTLNGNMGHFSQPIDPDFNFIDGYLDLPVGIGSGTGSYFSIGGPEQGPDNYFFNYTAAVPEPASWLLWATGLLLLGWAAWRRRQGCAPAASILYAGAGASWSTSSLTRSIRPPI